MIQKKKIDGNNNFVRSANKLTSQKVEKRHEDVIQMERL